MAWRPGPASLGRSVGGGRWSGAPWHRPGPCSAGVERARRHARARIAPPPVPVVKHGAGVGFLGRAELAGTRHVARRAVSLCSSASAACQTARCCIQSPARGVSLPILFVATGNAQGWYSFFVFYASAATNSVVFFSFICTYRIR